MEIDQNWTIEPIYGYEKNLLRLMEIDWFTFFKWFFIGIFFLVCVCGKNIKSNDKILDWKGKSVKSIKERIILNKLYYTLND